MFLTTQQGFRLLLILSWIIFAGVCIQAGGFIFGSFYTLVINPANAAHYWANNDLSALLKYDRGYFLVITLCTSITSLLKVLMFYLIVRIVRQKKLDMQHPFNTASRQFIGNLAYLSFGIGIITHIGANYTGWLVQQGVTMPDTQSLRLGGADVWIFMGVILLVIAQIFKRGIEIQSENELTV